MPNMGQGSVGVDAFNSVLAHDEAAGVEPLRTPRGKRGNGAGRGNGVGRGNGQVTQTTTPTSAMKARRVITKAGNQITECKSWETKLIACKVQCA
jgi:hypothetical protein